VEEMASPPVEGEEARALEEEVEEERVGKKSRRSSPLGEVRGNPAWTAERMLEK
jgi:hypothetical protein